MTEMQICPACDNKEMAYHSNFEDLLYGLNGSWPIYKCTVCAHEALLPVPTDNELKEYYGQEEYYSFNTSSKNLFTTVLRRLTRRMIPRKLNCKKLLDYGCGDGEVLLLAKQKGAQTFGIEFGALADHVKKKTGLKVEQEPDPKWFHKMDYVRSFHSFEHIKDPYKILCLFSDLIKNKGGRILIGVPNNGSWNARIFGRFYFYRGVPLHLHGYTPASLERLADRCNLRIVKLSTPSSFRGILGSIALMLQYLGSTKSKEPSLKILFLLSPIFIITLPYTIISRLALKGDVIEIELEHQ